MAVYMFFQYSKRFCFAPSFNNFFSFFHPFFLGRIEYTINSDCINCFRIDFQYLKKFQMCKLFLMLLLIFIQFLNFGWKNSYSGSSSSSGKKGMIFSSMCLKCPICTGSPISYSISSSYWRSRGLRFVRSSSSSCVHRNC